jgi:hypothetical protein
MAIAFCPDRDAGVSVGPRPKLGRRVSCPPYSAAKVSFRVSLQGKASALLGGDG